MGNVLVKNVTSRQKMCKLLNSLPNWFFKPTPRIFVNPTVLKFKQEMSDSAEEWDSALDFSVDSTQSLERECRQRKKKYGKSRQSYCCQHLNSDKKFEELHEEMRALRKQITTLLNADTSSTEETKTITVPAKDYIVPIPPPFPAPTSVPKSGLQQLELSNIDCNDKTTPTNILKEINTVKLRPITSTPKTKLLPKTDDVRNELYEILKKRYAATHSPAPRKFRKSLRDADDSDEENSFMESTFQIERNNVPVF